MGTDAPTPISRAGLLTTGTPFNQEELQHSWGGKPSASQGQAFISAGERGSRGEPRVHASALLFHLGSQENGRQGSRETRAGPDGTQFEESEASGGGALPDGQLQPLQEAASGLRGREGSTFPSGPFRHFLFWESPRLSPF